MTTECKRLVRDTLEAFKGIPKEKQQSKVDYIERTLALSESNNCFFEPTPDYINGAKIFLRIYRSQLFKN